MRYLMLAAALLAAGPGLMFAAVPADAATLLHPMFADHAVLQRDQPIPVYGEARPGAEVEFAAGQCHGHRACRRTGNGAPPCPPWPRADPYTLHAASGGDSQEVSDVLVGDVFLCTGQSNMQLSVRRAANAEAEIAAATDSRGARTGGGPRPQPRRSCPPSRRRWRGKWSRRRRRVISPPAVSYFARELRKHVKVPIGLITAAWGGTRDARLGEPPQPARAGLSMTIWTCWRCMSAIPWPASKALGCGLGKLVARQRQGRTLEGRHLLLAGGAAGLGPWNDWPGLSLPEGTAEPGVGFVGQLWLSTHVQLTAAQAAQGADPGSGPRQ